MPGSTSGRGSDRGEFIEGVRSDQNDVVDRIVSYHAVLSHWYVGSDGCTDNEQMKSTAAAIWISYAGKINYKLG